MEIERALYRAADVRELDRRVIEEHGVPAVTLMERAGAALFGAVRAHLPWASRALVLCGGGNNGGDGYVLARLLRQAGIEVAVCALVAPETLRGAALDAARAWMAAGGATTAFSAARFENADFVVDALLGTGLDRPVEGDLATVIRAVNGAGLPVVAADIPSGLNADTGAVMGVAVKADVTVSFIGLKAGLFTGHGPAVAGRIEFAPLDAPAVVYSNLPPLAERLDSASLQQWFPVRARNAHKGDFGHVLVLGGGRGMPGAARMAGEAALRGGAGRVSVAAWPGNVAAVAGARPELMCHGVENAEQLESLLNRADVLAAGPGLGQDVWAREMWQALQRHERRLPRVLDADALNWLAREPLPLNGTDVITPHPGEAARLLACSVADIEADRFAAVRRLAETFGAVCVLKGAGSLIASPEGRIRLCGQGNPGMASAGMGDLLTGLIAAGLAQGLAAFDAASAGVLVHALAGDRAARGGERGLLAMDLAAELRALVNPVPRKNRHS